ncbi:hypothetical protein LS70_000565 [Helicobacter sp. MIT 11-5569]|uniref:hypothetical protein n=1 Tax=Helicobacter sp. MIT 11-5569 TaxID=1548151 RepID=UPI00051FDAF6|nr:hypothetical protein [Helicobacter sp. MIT 11-5569]TLD85082.1 hypothetical protein LS70_000565 [Helicobacter sp. MIT 11-5569]
MNKESLDIEKQNLQIHYYFNDESHSMNAHIRNAMEKELLSFISELGTLLNLEIKIESKAREEGGLIDDFIIIINSIYPIAIAFFFKEAFNKIAIHYLTGGYKRNKLDNLLKEEQIRELKLKNDDFSKIIEKLQEPEQNSKIRRILSNFYKKAKNYEKIKQVGYQTNTNEVIVLRNDFNSFIVGENKDTDIIEDAKIEIISPVLKEGRFKWKGIYNKEKIDFSMGDSGFKRDVINQKYNFINGTIITCQLEICRTFDDCGEEIRISHRVKKVYDVEKNNNIQITKQGIKRKKQKYNGPSLFDLIEDNNKD